MGHIAPTHQTDEDKSTPRPPDRIFDIEALLAYNQPEAAPPALNAEIAAHVAAAWESVLGRSSIEADPCFENAGGDSLTALMLVGELETRCAVKLPLASFDLTMRPREVADLVARVAERPGPAAAPSSSLILLKAGSERPAVFLIHGLGGHVAELAELARHIECDHPIYGLQLPGLAEGEPALNRIDEMARLFVGPVQQTEPHGPCLLVGYSLGGLIAFELARQLRAAGRDARLLLIDSHPHPRYWPTSVWLRHITVRIHMQLRQLARGEAGDLRTYAGRMAQNLVNHWRLRRGSRSAHASSGMKQSASLERIRNGMIAAEAAYRPPRYSGRVTIVQADRREAGAPEDPRAVWRGRVASIDMMRVPGDHLSVVLEGAPATAACVDDWITAPRRRA